MNENKIENKNPRNNIGAIWKKSGTKSEYLLFKVTLDGTNYTLVAFPNSNKKEEDTSRVPDFYIFPFKTKENNENND